MNIDERLEKLLKETEALKQQAEARAREAEFLKQSTESLHHTCEALTDNVANQKRDTEEVATRTKKLEDQMLVQAELTTRFERRVDAWIESAETRMAKLEVFSAAVLERIDRFIAGQDRNGHENGGNR